MQDESIKPCLKCPKPCRQVRELLSENPLNTTEIQRMYKICQERRAAK